MLKRPKKGLIKADPVRRETLVAQYAALTAAMLRTGDQICFADEAHFRAGADPVSSTGQALPRYSPDFNADETV